MIGCVLEGVKGCLKRCVLKDVLVGVDDDDDDVL